MIPLIWVKNGKVVGKKSMDIEIIIIIPYSHLILKDKMKKNYKKPEVNFYIN